MVQQNAIHCFSWRLSCPRDRDVVFAENEQKRVAGFIVDTLNAQKWIFQLENSWLEKTDAEIAELKVANPASTHNLHFQCTFRVDTKVRPSALQKLVKEEFPGWSFNLSGASKAGVKHLQKYCMKKETRVAGPWADKRIYMGTDLITKENMVPQQKALLGYLLAADPSARGSIWIYCKKGGSGKSAFKKFCQYHYGWQGFSYAKALDVLHGVFKNQGKKVYFFNLTKSKPSEISELELYAALESIKDGDFYSPKYDGGNVLMDPCHVVVFANHPPNLHAVTQERFQVLKWKSLPQKMLKAKVDWDFKCETMTRAEVIAEHNELKEEARKAAKGELVTPTAQMHSLTLGDLPYHW